MMDDIIANAYDESGRKVELSIKDCYRTYLDMIRLLYHDYMIRIMDGDFESFKKMHMNATDRMINMIHSKYADHVEGIRMELFRDKRIKDPRDKLDD